MVNAIFILKYKKKKQSNYYQQLKIFYFLKKFFIKYYHITNLKKLKKTIFLKKKKLTIYLVNTINKYEIHNGRELKSVIINIIHYNTSFYQYSFTKKPFCGPIKKPKL